MAYQLPLLPGYRIETEPRTEFRKSHLFDVSNGVKLVDFERTQGIDAQVNPLAISNVPADYKYGRDSKFQAGSEQKLPAWVAYDRKVLRFHCFFKEAVHSSPVEHFRVRRCVLYFYLEDDSIHIAEPRIQNSGIPQGVFVKRHRIPRADGKFFSLDDLRIGRELGIYGRIFKLVDCDDFTRQFSTQQGTEQGAAQPYPTDRFTMKNTEPPHVHNKLMNPLKKFMEASLGKPVGIEIDSTQKFLRNDRKVLRFYCLWNDESMFGEKRPYILHYFLADDTVEVLEVKDQNSGRDPFPSLLRRQKLPKDFTQNPPHITRIGASGANAEDWGSTAFYTEEDLVVGSTIRMFGRELLLCGADSFTRDFYVQNFGRSPDDFPLLDLDNHAELPFFMEPPAYSGFGSEEDSLGSFLYLMPKVPKKDFKKMMEQDGVIIRFLAKFINPHVEDKDRVFVISYYLDNDTLSVFEKFERNSGFVGGKFLERARIKSDNSQEYYKESDLYVGAELAINQYSFKLIDCDEFTKKYIANRDGRQQGEQPSAEEAAFAQAAAATEVADNAPVQF
jgi:hypothetical protein